MNAKTCTRCERVLPHTAFTRPKSYWCRDCHNECNKRWKSHSRSALAAYKLTEGKAIDPSTYGRLTCDHVAEYLKRAIERFEIKTNNEAPPELTALYQLARRLTDKQATDIATRKTALTRECVVCGKAYRPKREFQSARHCSDHCREQAKRWREQERRPPKPPPKPKQPTAEDELRRLKKQGRAEARAITSDLARLMRLQGHKWQTISDTLHLSGPGQAYTLAHAPRDYVRRA